MAMTTADYCGAPVGFYGCPKHGVDCYDERKHMTPEELLIAIFGEQPQRDPAADQVLFTLCRHCNRAISLNPAKFYTDEAGNFLRPDWNLERYWCHLHLVDDEHLPEPKRPFIEHLWPIQ